MTTDPLILVLDDEAPIRAALAAILEHEHYEVFATENWSEISSRIFAAKDRRVVLITDLNMPGIRGEDFCATVRRHRPDVGIVIHTGSSSPRATAVGEELGAPVIIKGGDPRILVGVVRAQLLRT